MKIFDKCILLFALAYMFVLYATLVYREPNRDIYHKLNFKGFTAQDMAVPLPSYPIYDMPKRKPTQNKMVTYYQQVIKGVYLDNVPIRVVGLKLSSLGYYYCTAYCPEECGWSGREDDWHGWYTSSGAVCHRASYTNRYTEPTTCAVDRSLHRYGDLFYIPAFDRVFVAEDTGSAVKGKHLDLFYEDMSSVRSFPTYSYEVYSVEVVERLVNAGDYDVRDYIHDNQWNTVQCAPYRNY